MSFSSPWIRIRTKGLISSKYICNTTEYIELLLCQDFDCKQVEELGLLVTGLVVEAFSQLGIVVCKDNTWVKDR